MDLRKERQSNSLQAHEEYAFFVIQTPNICGRFFSWSDKFFRQEEEIFDLRRWVDIENIYVYVGTVSAFIYK